LSCAHAKYQPSSFNIVVAFKEKGRKLAIIDKIMKFRQFFDHISAPREKLKIWLMTFLTLIWQVSVCKISASSFKTEGVV